jgi:hypothetical protein
MKAIVERADPVAPRINAGFFEYAQSRGFAIDPARVRTPTDYPEDLVIPSIRLRERRPGFFGDHSSG